MTRTREAQRGKALITGGCGFIGSHLADAILSSGDEVVILDSLIRIGSERNLIRLRERHQDRLSFIKGDVRDCDLIGKLVSDVEVIFHLAAQVAVTSSLADPQDDFSVNIGGTMHVLEAARTSHHRPGVIFASTNKVYGDLGDLTFEVTPDGYQPANDLAGRGIQEDQPLQFRTPYGCSKGAADQYVLDYGSSFGLHTLVLRMSCIYGPWQMGTEDQGWVAHFAHRLAERKKVTIFGDGLQVRDLLYIDDAVRAYLSAWDNLHRFQGAVFNLGGGPKNAVSVECVLRHLAKRLGRSCAIERADWREGDQRWYVSSTEKIQIALNITPQVPWTEGLERLLNWIAQETSPHLFPAEVAS